MNEKTAMHLDIIFSKHSSDKGLWFTICKRNLNSSKKTSNRIEVGKWFEDTSPNKTYMTHKGIIKHLLSLITREMRIKITIRLQYRHIRMAKSKKIDQNKYWSGCGRHAHWETAWQFLRKLKINSYHTIQTILRNVPHRKESICPNTYMSIFLMNFISKRQKLRII